MKTFTPQEKAEYLAGRNRKLMSSTVIFLNESDKVLILRTTYKKDWEVPGGGIEQDESPMEAAVREVQEELGITINRPDLLGVDYRHTSTEREEMMHFTFLGGVLSQKMIDKIVLQQDEIESFKFVSRHELEALTGSRVSARVARALTAIKSSSCVYWDSN
ncbi:MAG: NUDIX hydrolase [Patescibacteria group bacterium]